MSDSLIWREGGLRGQGVNKSSLPGAPLVSVITVVRNGLSHLEQTIQSVLQQSYRNIEYIIIDGCSTDGTLDIIRRYDSQVDYWVSEPDAGMFYAMNKGLAVARGELINLLNADDFFESDAVRLMVEAFKRYGGDSVYFGNNYLLDDLLGLKTKITPGQCVDYGLPFCHQTMFLSSKAYAEVGGYDTGYKVVSDYDLVLRLIKHGYQLKHIDEVIVNFRLYGMTSRRWLYHWFETGKVIVGISGFNAVRLFQLFRSFSVDLLKVAIKKALPALLGRNLARGVILRLTKLSHRECGKMHVP